MTILLGLFNTGSFYYTQCKYSAEAYPFRVTVPEDFFGACSGILDVVSLALSRCQWCIFVLDGLNPESLDYEGYTNKELLYILDNPYLLDKITFILDGAEVTQEFVISKYTL